MWLCAILLHFNSLIEDSIQNLFGYLLNKRLSLKPVSNLTFFLLNSFRHELFLQIRKRDRVSFSDSKPEDNNLFCYNLVEDKMKQEVRDLFSSIITEHVKKLGTRQQEIIFLRFHQELNYTEIAEMLDITVDSCYKSVHRSIKLIKDELEKTLPNAKQFILYFSLLLKEKILI